MRPRLLILLCLGASMAMLGAVLLTWGFGPLLARAGSSRGLTFSRYERIGYTRFALHRIELRHPWVHVKVARLEADVPWVAWLRRGEVVVAPWSVDVLPRAPMPPPSPTGRGWMPLRATLRRVAEPLARWTPQITLHAGVVRWPGAELSLASARWRERTLFVRTLGWRDWKADAALVCTAEEFRLIAGGTGGRLRLESRGSTVTGDLHWARQRAELRTLFEPTGWLPSTAELHARDWQVPGEQLRLGHLYRHVQGQGEIVWRAPTLTAEFSATGVPGADTTIPPLAVMLRGQGDLEAFTIEALSLTLPGITALLSEAVTVERSGKFRSTDARFTVEADLAQQPWFTARGQVNGAARWTTPLDQVPVVEFEITARDVAAADWKLATLAARGQFAWPTIQIHEATLTGVDGDQLQGHGGWDFVRRELLPTTADGKIRSATVARWLPPDLAFEEVALHAEAAGPLTELRHRGTVAADAIRYAALPPVGVKLAWSGRGPTVASLSAEGLLGSIRLRLAGTSAGDTAQLTRFELTQAGVTRLQLQEPASVRWRPTRQLEGLRLAGPEGTLALAGAWGTSGYVTVRARELSFPWLEEMIGARWSRARLTALALEGRWDGGPMTYALEGTAEIPVRTGQRAIVAARLEGDAAGLRIANLGIVEEGKDVVRVAGRIPLRLSPAASPPWAFDSDGGLALDATTEPNATLWRELADLTGVDLEAPEAAAHLTGTWGRPQGTFQLRAARVTADAARFPWPLPTVEALTLDLSADASEVRLDRLALTLEGQAVRAQARLPVQKGTWRERLTRPASWLQSGAEGRIDLPGADVAALARLLPDFVAPSGRLQAHLTFKGGALGGSLQLRDAMTRPLGPLGVMQELNAEVEFSGRTATLRSVTAQTGGQTVALSGTVAWPETPEGTSATDARGLEALRFDLALTGKNLPFVRQTGVLVRGDLDLRLSSPERGAPRLGGEITLRESLFLSDLRALLPGGARTKSRGAPYFAVEQAPFATWRLDVAVQGERFLKLRTPLFSGVASAKFQLTGTLGQPEARGEATLNEGIIRLPFATFVVQEGRVTLTPENAGEPQVSLIGTVRRMGRDLRLEASGPASAPVLLFSSSPPLESGQVLLLVMTGISPTEGMVFTDRQRVARFGTFLGQGLVASLGSDSEAGERLSISSGENVSRQGRETYGIEYRLNEDWSMVGDYDEFDEFNAGVKWRVFSRGGSTEVKK